MEAGASTCTSSMLLLQRLAFGSFPNLGNEVRHTASLPSGYVVEWAKDSFAKFEKPAMTPNEISQIIERTERRFESLRDFLRDSGFVFQYPDEVFPGAAEGVERMMAEIDAKAGRVPEALRQFYTMIGSVNFNGYHPDWNGCEYPDALIIFPLNYAEVELSEYLYDKEGYRAAYDSFRIPIAPDHHHKEGVSGGMWYGVPVPSADLDPPLLEEPHETSFLQYLEIALHWGGFPGLEHADADHTWPLSDLRKAAIGPSSPLS
jgi:hypothetical protein